MRWLRIKQWKNAPMEVAFIHHVAGLGSPTAIALPDADEPDLYTSIIILWDHLWLMNHNANRIYEYNFDGIEAGLLENHMIIHISRAASNLGNGDIVIVARIGLYMMSQKAYITGTRLPGDFCDTC